MKVLKKTMFSRVLDVFRRGLGPSIRPSEAEIIRIMTGASLAGNAVTEEKALRFSAVYACVRVLSESVAQLPLKVYRRKGGERQEASDHYLYPLLHDAPNPKQTAFSFWEAVTASLTLWGNAYALIDFDTAGRVAALWLLDPSSVYPRKA
ncbi:MAG TPA: phage portal protein, partial [Geobacteraceae bacterium]|nr:phage portal protein [Geobacteraceae bacterium]